MARLHGGAPPDKTTSFATNRCTNIFRHEKPPSSPTLEILAFETAKTMSRLVALYKSLSDDEFLKLREGPIKSPGVEFLNSRDETYLLGLACKEKLEDLNHVAAVVTRLGKKCIDEELTRFDIAYHNMKHGIIDFNKIDYSARSVVKMVEKMEKYAKSTSLLYGSLVGLNELEVSEKKMQKWKRNGAGCAGGGKKSSAKTNIEYFNDKISFQRKQVKHYRQISLWSQTYDKSVGLMARTLCVVFARLCCIFEPYVPTLPRATKSKSQFQTRLYVKPAFHFKVHPEANYCLINKDKYGNPVSSKSGPIIAKPKIKRPARFHSGELLSPKDRAFGFKISTVTKTDKFAAKSGILVGNTTNNTTTKRNQKLIQTAPASTVGAAGLAVRYANVIIMAENYFYSAAGISDEAREHVFEMLPIGMKHTLRGKLKSHWCRDAEERDGQQGLAEGWKEALEEIIGWLAPMAHDTLRWQQERNLEQQKLDAKATVLLLQTLHFSDLEKTEAAIVEVLVGLSCIYRYENRRERDNIIHIGGVGYKR